MSKLFRPPKAPEPPPPPAPVEATPPPARTDPTVVQAEDRERVRRKRGRLATVLSAGDAPAPQVGVKTLLGG